MTEQHLHERARKRALWGLLANWDAVAHEPWVANLISWEEDEHRRRSLEYRTGKAKLGKYRPLADFDWSWPKKIDRTLVEDLFDLAFVREAANVVVMGPNGVGKTMIAQNLAHQALLRGHKVRFTMASDMLAELAACDGATALARTLAKYTQPQVLVIDEVGYLGYGNRHADLLFEIISRRYEKRPTIITTNRPFGEWGEVFPNAACVTALVDRLLHKAEVIKIEGDSYRAKEAAENAKRKRRSPPRTPS